jgi:hypothetical protein
MALGIFWGKGSPFSRFFKQFLRGEVRHDDLPNPIRADDFNGNHGFGDNDDSFRQYSFQLFDCIKAIVCFLIKSRLWILNLFFYLHIWLSFELKKPI